MKNILFYTALFLLALQSCAPAKLLRQQPANTPGYTLAMRQTVQTETKMTMFGEDRTSVSSSTSEFEYKIISALPNGNLNWEMKMLRFTSDNNDGSQHYDSADPERDTSSIVTKIYDKMIGHKMYMTTTLAGQILTFSGANTLFDNILSTFSDKPEMQPLGETVKKSFGDSAMVQTVSDMWGYIPEKPIKIGQSWKKERNQSGLISLNTNYQYKLKSRDANQAIISSKSTTQTPPGDASTLDLGKIKIIYNLKGSGAGQTIIAQPDGSPIKSTHTINASGVMKMSGEGIPGAIDVPISIKTTVASERISQ